MSSATDEAVNDQLGKHTHIRFIPRYKNDVADSRGGVR